MRKFASYGPALLVLITAAMTLIAGPTAIRQIQAARTAATVTLAQQRLDGDDLMERINQATRDIAASVEPSVVFIESRVGIGGGRTVRSTGSGWVYDADGHIVTNAHVVNNAVRIEAQFNNGQVRSATFIGRDESTDVAVIKVEPDPTVLFPARRATGEPVFQGDTVFAFGSPFGFKFSMSKGIVSGLGREAFADAGQTRYTNFIQTDAAINPGNSGGPLVDVRGRVIGMNTAIITDEDRQSSPSGAVSGVSGGISFAIPLETVEAVVSQLIKRGVVVRGFLGVALLDIADVRRERPEQMEAIGFTGANGVLITRVEPGLAADRGGVMLGDVITSVDERPTPTTAVLRSAIGNRAPGEKVALTVWREGESVELEVTLMAAVVNAAGALAPIEPGRLATLDSAAARGRAVREALAQFGVTLLTDGEGGVRIAEVAAGSPAEDAGFAPGQKFIRVGRSRVRSEEQLFEAFVPTLFNEQGAPTEVRVENGREGERRLWVTLARPASVDEHGGD